MTLDLSEAVTLPLKGPLHARKAESHLEALFRFRRTLQSLIGTPAEALPCRKTEIDAFQHGVEHMSMRLRGGNEVEWQKMLREIEWMRGSLAHLLSYAAGETCENRPAAMEKAGSILEERYTPQWDSWRDRTARLQRWLSNIERMGGESVDFFRALFAFDAELCTAREDLAGDSLRPGLQERAEGHYIPGPILGEMHRAALLCLQHELAAMHERLERLREAAASAP